MGPVKISIKLAFIVKKIVYHSVFFLGIIECSEIGGTLEDRSWKNSWTLLICGSYNRKCMCMKLECLRPFPICSSLVVFLLLSPKDKEIWFIFLQIVCVPSRTVRNKTDLFSFGSWRMVLTVGTVQPGPGGAYCSLLYLHRENNMVGLFRLYPYMLTSWSFYNMWSIGNNTCILGRF